MKSILDASFKYTPSHATDIRKLFARVRREQEREQERERQPVSNVQPLQRKGAKQ